MPSHIADYEIIEPVDPGEHPRSYLCRPPSRLGHVEGQVVVTGLLVPEDAWTCYTDRVRKMAGALKENGGMIEVGRLGGEGGGGATNAWIARVRPPGKPLSALPPGTENLDALAGASRQLDLLHQAGLAHGDLGLDTIWSSGSAGVLDPPLTLSPANSPAWGLNETDRLDRIDPAEIWGVGASRATDIWALGAAIQRALTGQSIHPELTSDSPATGMQRVLLEPPQIDAHLPSLISELVRSCVTKNPMDRPASASSVAGQLEEAREEIGRQ